MIAPRFTGLRAIEKNGLRGFGFSIHFDRDNQSPAPSSPQANAGSGDHPTLDPAPIQDEDR